MQTIYCIPGLGADEKAFSLLDLSFANTVFVQWLKPLPEESLSNYATRLKAEFIREPEPVILGLSLGGMLAVEIAKSIPMAKAIIISSAKTRNELPPYWKMLKYMPVHKILPDWSIKSPVGLRSYFLGARSSITKNYINELLEKADGYFYRWALGAIFNWQNQIIPLNVTHIHGTNDRLLPFRFVKADITINNAGHLMIMENAAEISTQLGRILRIDQAFKTEKNEKYA